MKASGVKRTDSSQRKTEQKKKRNNKRKIINKLKKPSTPFTMRMHEMTMEYRKHEKHTPPSHFRKSHQILQKYDNHVLRICFDYNINFFFSGLCLYCKAV